MHKGYDLYTDGVFLKANSSLVGAADGISIQFPNRDTHHEVELVAVIGMPAKDVTPGDALKHVAAYSVGLDITMRGKEERSLRKSFDTYSVLGPWLVTADEIPDPENIELSLAVNGVERQRDSTENMLVDTAAIIAFASKFYTLMPGDLIWTGTPSGVGRLVGGDRVRAGADRIGMMDVNVRLTSNDLY
jgi:2-keto-4-pentenoate hydratase/2-oxohepta-3-ene-1,7-dioic acid hydratase in catechol pathway